MRMKIKVTHSGARLVAVAASGLPTTIPYDDTGTSPRMIRVAVEPLTSVGAFAYVRLGPTGATLVTVTNSDLMVNTYEPVILESRGFYTINAISGTGALTVYVNVVALENG